MNTAAALPPAFLVLPEPGDKSAAAIYAKVRAIALRQLLTFPDSRVSPATRRSLVHVRKVLARLLQTHPQALAEAVAHPDVQVPLLVLDVPTEITGQDPDKVVQQAIPPLLAILAHLAPRGVIPEAMLWDHPLTVLADAPGHRLLRFDPPARGVLADPLGCELNLADETKVRLPPAPAVPDDRPGLRSERPFHRLTPDLPRLEFAMYDSNPLSMYEAHPEKWGNAISLGDKSLQHWLGAFREALDHIKVGLPEWYEELKHTLRRIVPVGYLPERHLSASYREAPGLAYLTLCDDPLTIAEAIVHETQHSKVNALSWIDPVVHNGLTTWTQSPVRPDLRPLWGVLLAVHAFVPVAAMYDRLASMGHPVSQTERFARRRAEILAGNHRGMVAVLEKSEASEQGGRMIREMNRLHSLLRERAADVVRAYDIAPDTLPDS
jgi:HEXXH motif-containing protein